MSSPEAAATSPSFASSPAEAEPAPSSGPQTTITPGAKISNEWELDVYSRPVVGADGKKLWELLICDSTGNFRHVSPIPSNMVNSREVRKTIEDVIDSAPGGSRPTVIRFFRSAMFNMIDIALKEVEIVVKPCRTTYAMYQWLQEREQDVYPKMPGFKPAMKQAAFFDIRVRRLGIDKGEKKLVQQRRNLERFTLFCLGDLCAQSVLAPIPRPFPFRFAPIGNPRVMRRFLSRTSRGGDNKSTPCTASIWNLNRDRYRVYHPVFGDPLWPLFCNDGVHKVLDWLG